MRIRSKLITVQLILTLTLILSIIILSSHMSTVMQVKDARISIEQFDTEVKIFNNYNKTILNRRESVPQIRRGLNTNKNRIKRKLEDLNKNSLLKRAVVTDKNNPKLTFNQRTLSVRYNNFVYTSAAKNLIDSMTALSEIDSSGFIKELGLKPSVVKIENITNEDIDRLYNSYNKYIKEFNTFSDNWDDLYISHIKKLKNIAKISIIRSIAFLVITIIISLILNYKITNKITINLNSVNNSLKKMTEGDFSSGLNIAAGDEFGDLSRNFNSFIDELWKKLDSMNAIMGDIGHAMADNLDLTKIYTNIITNVTNHIVSDAGGLFLLDGDKLRLAGSKGFLPPFFPIEEDLSSDRPTAARYLKANPTSIETPIINECFTKKEPVIVRNCETDPSFPQCRNKNSALYIGSFMMVPLINAGNIIGALVLVRTTHTSPFTDLDISNFTSFSDYASLTIDTLEKYNELLEKFEMQKEIGVAADIQKNLIPDKMPKIKGISSGAYTLAAKGVSGDYYDFFQMNRTTIGATVCDVAGKGVPASLVMVMIRTILRLVASPRRGAAETLNLLNKSISGKINVDRYATMGFFKIDLETMKLSYSNAAHHPIQIFRQESRKFYAIDSPGLPVGIDRDSQFSEKRVNLLPGDIIFMYTDGFPEARNPDGVEYSTNRMLREIRLHCHKNAKEILDSVVTDMQKFTLRAKQHDDQTILIVKIDEEM